jgi:hypothetical protein
MEYDIEYQRVMYEQQQPELDYYHIENYFNGEIMHE